MTSDPRDLRGEKTRPGFAIPEVPAIPFIDPPEPAESLDKAKSSGIASHGTHTAPLPAVPDDDSAAHAPIEVEFVLEQGSKPVDRERWTAVEVHTLNRIYALDASLVCIEVLNRATRAAETSHALIGARLVGGQTPTPRGMELSYPYPRIGAESVFEHRIGPRVRFSHTSKVERVVVRVRVVAVEQTPNMTPAWEELTGHRLAVLKKPAK